MDMGVTVALLIALVCMVGGIFLWIKFYNSEDAERHMKQRMQGPFVPEPKEQKTEN